MTNKKHGFIRQAVEEKQGKKICQLTQQINEKILIILSSR
jgi:hypothetical protein